MTLSHEEQKQRLKQKQKEYRKKVYQALKAKKAEFDKVKKEQKKLAKAQDREEALRKKNAQLWEALRLGSQLSSDENEGVETQEKPFSQNPFIS